MGAYFRSKDVAATYPPSHEELYNEYVLAFSPASVEADSKHQQAQMKVVPTDVVPLLQVSWRTGYRATVE